MAIASHVTTDICGQQWQFYIATDILVVQEWQFHIATDI